MTAAVVEMQGTCDDGLLQSRRRKTLTLKIPCLVDRDLQREGEIDLDQKDETE